MSLSPFKMRKTNRYSTQSFLDFTDVRQGLIQLTQSEYTMVLEVSAINFDLKSPEEKAAVIAGYRDFLNSLHFPIQINARSEMLRLDGYFSGLKKREEMETSEVLKEQLLQYRRFVQELITNRNILARRYYLILNWLAPNKKGSSQEGWLDEALRHLSDRRVTVENGLRRIGLSVHQLTDEELLALLKKSYGGHQNQSVSTPVRDHLTLKVVEKS
jgi:hypothetical protein